MHPRDLVRIACCLTLLTSSIANANDDYAVGNIYIDGIFSVDANSPCANGNCLLSNAGNSTSLVISDQNGQPLALSAFSIPRVTATKKTSTSVTVSNTKSATQRTFDAFVPQPVHDIAPLVLVEQGVPWVQPESEIVDSQPGVDPNEVGCSPDSDEPEDVGPQNVVKPRALRVEPVVVPPSQVPSVRQSTYTTTGIPNFDWSATVPVSIPSSSVPPTDSPFSVDTLQNGFGILPNLTIPGSGTGSCATGNCPRSD